MSTNPYKRWVFFIWSTIISLSGWADILENSFRFSVKLTGKRATEERWLYISRARTAHLEGFTDIFMEVLPDSSGVFSSTVPCQTTETLTLSGTLFRATLIAEPGAFVECTIAIPDSIAAGFQSKPLIRTHITSPETGLHAGLEQAENALQTFYTKHYALFIKPKMLRPKLQALDSTFKAIGTRFNFEGVHSYCRHSLAQLYEICGANKATIERTYIMVPAQKRDRWWYEFAAFHYKNYFSRFQTGPGWKELEDAIQVLHSIDQVRSVVKKLDPIQTNDTLRDILIIKGLFDIRNQKNIQSDAVRMLISYLCANGIGAESRELAKTCLHLMVRFEAGERLELNFITQKELDLLVQQCKKNRFIWWCAFDPDGPEMEREWVLLNKLMTVYDRQVGVVLSPTLVKKGQRFTLSPLLERGKDAAVLPINNLRQAEQLGISSLPFSSLVELDADEHLIWNKWSCPLPSQGLEIILKQKLPKHGK
jgi:hypothetical protein